MSPQLYSYLLAHTREPPVLQQLRLETAGMQGGHMQVGFAAAFIMDTAVQQLQHCYGQLRRLQACSRVGAHAGACSLPSVNLMPPTLVQRCAL
jgi:hypothetical protein